MNPLTASDFEIDTGATVSFDSPPKVKPVEDMVLGFADPPSTPPKEKPPAPMVPFASTFLVVETVAIDSEIPLLAEPSSVASQEMHFSAVSTL